jgi:hypothetical protein
MKRSEPEAAYIKQQRNAEARLRRASDALARLAFKPWRELYPEPIDPSHDERDARYWCGKQRALLRTWERIEKAVDRWLEEAPGVWEIGIGARGIGKPRRRHADMHVSDTYYANGDGTVLSPRIHYWHPLHNCFGDTLRHARQCALLARRWFVARDALNDAWELEAARLALEGQSAREIGRRVGKPASTVSRAVKKWFPHWNWEKTPRAQVERWHNMDGQPDDE